MPPDTSERWRLVEEAFHKASECTAEQRAARLEEWCAGDGELRREVESLLEAAAHAEDAEKQVRSREPETSGCGDRLIGRTIGAYRLDRLIGRGGMGAVYFGRRIAGDFEQQIALKLVSSRLNSPWLRRRFSDERQMLASLSHPHIARLLDGGITQDGEPYLVMEYVDGLRLDEYCDRKDVRVADIVRLFLQLCDAVSYVHRHLILHRDLKPGNVLVTSGGAVKLLDFGAAKLLHPDSPPRSESTRLGMRLFTPAYASPEQALGGTMTAASDVYSLGVILYQLLARRLPFQLEGLPAADVARTIIESVPVSPHEAVTPPADCLESRPSADIESRQKEIRGDLDAIVLQALRANPQERYSSVDRLADDLRNHLDHRPVQARKGSIPYQTAKFIRRHAFGLGTAMAIATAIGGGIAVTAQAGRVAANEEARAREGFRDVRRLANLLLFDVYDQVKQLQGSTQLQRRLVTQALTFLDELSRDVTGEADVQLDLIDGYTKMGNVLGNPYEENLGDVRQATGSLEKALHLAEALARDRPHDRGVIRRLDIARRSLAEVHFSAGDTARAIAYSRAAAQSFEQLALLPDATLADTQEAAATFDSLGDLYGLHGSASTGDLRAALDCYRRSLALHQRALVLKPGNVRSVRGVAILQMKIANAQSDAKPGLAAQGYATALEALDQLPGDQRQTMPTPRIEAIIRHKLGNLSAALGRPQEAVRYLVSARDLFASMAERDPDNTRPRFDLATIEYDLGQVREEMADPAAALEDYHRVVRILEDLLQRDRSNLVWRGHRAEALYRIGYAKRQLGDSVEADRAVREALTVALQIAASAGSSAADLDRAAEYLATVEPVNWRDPTRAVDLATRAVEKSSGANARFLLTLAQAQKASGNLREASLAIEKALALLPAPEAGEPTAPLRRAAEGLLVPPGSQLDRDH